MISKGIIRGDSHQLRCDDSYFSHEDENHVMIAVFDGCSSSKYASVASQLMAEAMNNIIFSHRWTNINIVLNVLYNYIDEFISRSCVSSYKREDYRSTLIIAVINKKEKTVETINIGDGLIFIDGECKLNSDTNVTDYMVDSNVIYNLNNCNRQEFKFEKSVTISTDGLNSFKGHEEINKEEIYEIFHSKNKFYKTENFVQRTCRVFQRVNKIINDDDIAIVRYESDDE